MTTHPSSPFVPLPLPSSSTKWLISPHIASNSYTVFLTDQSSVYRESLNDQEIIERAQDNDSPIDPSLGKKQFKSLLEKLRAGLIKESNDTILTLTRRKQEITITIRIQLSARVHLTWTFDFQPYGNMSSILVTLARTGLYYQSLVTSLTKIIGQKDTHISALQEKLSDLGGSYFPRKYKGALESWDADQWREDQRKRVREEEMSGVAVFDAWREVAEDVNLDWEAVVAGLREWDGEMRDEKETKKGKDVEMMKDEDEFEEPESIGKTKKKVDTRKGKDEETDEEEDMQGTLSTNKASTSSSRKPPPATSKSPLKQLDKPKKSQDSDSDEWADPSSVGKNKRKKLQKPNTPEPEMTIHHHKKPPVIEDDTTDEEEDQAVSPPRLRSRDEEDTSRTISPVQRKGSSADEPPVTKRHDKTEIEDEDEDFEEPKGKSSISKSRIRSTPQKAGKSPPQSGNRRKSESPEEESDEEVSRKRIGKSKISASDEDTEDEEVPPKTPVKAKIRGKRNEEPVTPKKKITSKIGGKKAMTPEPSPKKFIKSKIGGRTSRESTMSPTRSIKDEDGETKVKEESQSSQQKRELTADEKAREKRNQLKRELEEKKKHPVKKVRKF